MQGIKRGSLQTLHTDTPLSADMMHNNTVNLANQYNNNIITIITVITAHAVTDLRQMNDINYDLLCSD